MSAGDKVALEFLGRLERDEARLLAWGVVDVGFTDEELLTHAREFLAEPSRSALWTADGLLEWLVEHRLLLTFDYTGERVRRTRMAETVRLAARLRQLFPKHMVDGRFRVAPTLVADYRFALRPRVYPKRDIEPGEAVEQIARLARLEGDRRRFVETLLQCPEPRRLGAFQRDAAAAVLANLDGGTTRGVIVCAGTGSGKTLAFYLPALSHVGTSIDARHWTKALAIYPRNELLKDQFTETYREARKLDPVLIERRGRKLIIGAYFGPTPRDRRDIMRKSWRPVAGGYVCPFFRCPRCEADMRWADADLEQGVERLQCTRRGCVGAVAHDEIMLTRARMEQTPPDVLFTTTEMLNRNMGNSETGHLFGIGPRAPRPPDLVLVDEVHTYEGTAGAQAALLLRRWRHAVRRPIQFVGLSATLRDAQQFFARLIGLPDASVTRVEPLPGDMEREGMEYLLALRGDPVSATSLLSTTIQASMLLRRMLDDRTSRVSAGAYGTKLFAFTDNLDVINRLYFNLLDAEGRNSFGSAQHDRACGSLAQLRAREYDDLQARAAAGQLWEACEEIGHALTPADRLVIERTSSQDVGVDPNADVVVATSTLEVGYNDPDVGAVLQHKAPHGSAQFLQRKGRAGRTRRMRPWTVVVLSDYGRDRLAYQGYELLFDPVIETRHLPVGNRHVLRIQAAQAMMDWLAARVGDEPRGSVWDDLSGPAHEHQAWRGKRAEKRQGIIARILEGVLHGGEEREALTTYLQRALKIAEREVLAILWEPPRALLTAVVPTLLRRLRSGWASARLDAGTPTQEHWTRWHPMPEFLPANLFSDLNLPEVVIVTPPARRGDDPNENMMPIAQALREYAPGRVSRRYGVVHRYARHWLRPHDLAAAGQALPVADFLRRFEPLGSVRFQDCDRTHEVRLLRPLVIEASVPPPSVTDSSNGRQDWHTQIGPVDEGFVVPVPEGSIFSSLLEEIRFYTHSQRSGVEVRRFSLGSRATISLNTGVSSDVAVRYVDDSGADVAVGFGFRADGLAIRYRMPADLDVSPASPNRAKVRALRADYFRHRVSTSPALDGLANHFERIWLHHAYASALVATAVAERTSLEVARARLHAGDARAALRSVLEILFQTMTASEDEVIGLPKMQRVLLERLDDAAVIGALHEAASSLWASPDAAWHAYVAARFRATLGAATLAACEALCPEFGARDLVVDLDPGPRPTGTPPASDMDEIWLTEDGPGGGGVVDELARRIADDPRRFLRMLEAALEPSDFEQADQQLSRLLAWTEVDGEVQAAMRDARAASGNEATFRAFANLHRVLAQRGLVTSHLVIATMNARVLRPGSSPRTDALLRELLRRWRDEEERLDIEIDGRVFACTCALDPSIEAKFIDVPAPVDSADEPWRFSVVYSLLWPRGAAVRAQALALHNPYADLPAADPHLVLDRLVPRPPGVCIEEEGWLDEVRRRLATSGVAALDAPLKRSGDVRAAMLLLSTLPIEVDGLHLHPRIVGIRYEGERMTISFEFREVME
ncbi:protein DpdJ [Sorangium sp. So ce134]